MIEQTNNPVMQKAVQVIYDMSEDTRLREIARLREKALHDEAIEKILDRLPKIHS